MRVLRGITLFHQGLFRHCGRRPSHPQWLMQMRYATPRPASWDYETEKRNFKLKAPEHYNFARDCIDFWAAKEKAGERANTPAFWWVNDAGREQKWTFQDLSYLSKRVANILTGPCKLKPGDKIIVMLPRVPEWWLINIAAIRAGIILSPGTTLLRSNDIRYRLNASLAKCVITYSPCADNVDEVEKDCPSLQTKVIVGDKRAGWFNFEDLMSKSTDMFDTYNSRFDEPMTVFFTSGTTGSPKMAEHTHSSYGLGHLITAKYFLDLKPTDILWNLSDTGWAKCAWSSLFAPWIAGACVFAQDSAKFDPELTIKILKTIPINTFCAPPTAVRLMQVNPAFSSLRNNSLIRSVSGGEPVNPELLEAWKEGTGLKLMEGYGQTETTFVCGTYDSIEQRPGSMGKAAPGYDVQIVDTDGNVLPSGTEGEMAIRCKPERPCGLFTRYIDDELRMQKAFTGDFYLTGDRAVMDEEGYFWFVGRSDDVIVSSGYRIGPFEVESTLLEHPAVLESAVVSSPDAARGEIVAAYVTLAEGYKTGDQAELVHHLQEHCKTVTAPYKYPRKIIFVDSLPKTVSGKIRRVELRNKEWGRSESD